MKLPRYSHVIKYDMSASVFVCILQDLNGILLLEKGRFSEGKTGGVRRYSVI